jgi:hypothetical protein
LKGLVYIEKTVYFPIDEITQKLIFPILNLDEEMVGLAGFGIFKTIFIKIEKGIFVKLPNFNRDQT